MNTTSKRRLKKVTAKQILPELSSLFLFVITSLFAVFISYYLQLVGQAPSQSGTGNFYSIILYIIVTIVFTFIVIYLARKNRLRVIKVVFFFLAAYIIFYVSLIVGDAVYSGIYMLYYSFGQPALNTVMYLANVDFYIIWLCTPIILIYLLIKENEWYITNTVGVFMSAGLASLWGLLLNVWYSVALLVIFAVYDYISVYRTKHMISLAKAAVDEKLPMLFVFPSSRDFSMKKVTWDDRHEGDVMMLGFGDIALPSILVASSAIYGLSTSVAFLLFPLIGGLIGMAALLFFGVKKPAPGLPFINSGTIIGFLIAFLLFRPF